MKNLRKNLSWLDNHALLILSSFLLAFIPLYPKLPLFEAIPGYIVRVRLEDLLLAGTLLLWGIQVLRKKIDWKTPLTLPIILYAVGGLLTIISGVLVTQTIPAETIHIGKSLLHYFRYLEYFSLFFIVFSSIKTKKHLQISFVVIAATLLAVSIYGYGQKHWYWPVYSTMNREFSKGIRLYLTEHARVQSTFGGHYDLGGYLVIILPIILAAAYVLENKWQRLASWIVFTAGVWLLVLTASRTSFVAYGFAALIVLAILSLAQKKRLKSLWWFIQQSTVVLGLTGILMLAFGSDMYERLLQVLEGYPKIHDTYHSANAKRKEVIEYVPKLLGINTTVEKPKNGISTDDATVLVASDTRPITTKPGDKPSDVYVDVPDKKKVASVSASGETVYEEIEVERTYSDNALKHGLSLAIRLDTLWPRALEGFYRNPVLGSGYATLTKESVEQFTEAESTDNNYLRTLGETGLAGFIFFYGTIGMALYAAISTLPYLAKKDAFVRLFVVGYIAGSIGLLLNALYIDIYAASKVALTFWGITGIIMAIYVLYVPKNHRGKIFDVNSIVRRFKKK